jgi:hypothetical protein
MKKEIFTKKEKKVGGIQDVIHNTTRSERTKDRMHDRKCYFVKNPGTLFKKRNHKN